MKPRTQYTRGQLVKLYFKPLATGDKTPFLQYRSENNEIIREYCKDDKGQTYHIIPERTDDDKRHNSAVMVVCQKLRAVKELQVIEQGGGIKQNKNTNYLIADITRQYSENLSENSKLVYCNMLATLDDIKRLQDVTPTNLRQWLVTLGDRKNSTKHLYFSKLHTVVRYAVRKKYISKDPFDELDSNDKKTLRSDSAPREYLTVDELAKLSAARWPNDILKNAFFFSCYTGLRWSDIIKLRWSDITSDGDIMSVRIQMTKTKDYITVPLNDKAKQFLPTIADDGQRLFPVPKGDRASIKKAIRRAGITKNISFHSARHTFAVSLITAGVDLYTVSKLLGHHDISTTQIYSDVINLKKIDAVNKL